MQITYYKSFSPLVDTQSVVDDFGNLTEFMFDMSYETFTAAKLFITGMTFEDAGLRSILPAHEEH